MIDKKIQGKKNRAAGARFERKVRADLESKGWIVDRWGNNVKLEVCKTLNGKKINYITNFLPDAHHELVPAKSTRFRSNTHGFPDFIAFRDFAIPMCAGYEDCKEIMGVEAKSNGYLKPEERAKCKWLLKKKIFSKILIASKGNKRGEIKYKEVKNEI